MLIVFFDMEGMVHAEFLPTGATVNAAFYVEVVKCLREAVRLKRQVKWKNWWFLHHDNAPCHMSLSIQQFLAEKKKFRLSCITLFARRGIMRLLAVPQIETNNEREAI